MRNPPIIDQILPVGLHLVHSRPKAGLSPLLLRFAAAVASGGAVAGYQAQQGGVLFVGPLACCGELRRAQRQLATIEARSNIRLTDAPTGEAFGPWVRGYLDEHRGTRLVAVSPDWGAAGPYDMPYLEEKRVADVLSEACHRYGAGLVLARETRRAGPGSVFGTMGFAGGCDTIAELRGGQLRIVSRAVAERYLAIDKGYIEELVRGV